MQPNQAGTYVTQVTATDADDPTYGNSARVVYSILHGQPYFSVDPKTGVIKTALPNMDREVKEQYQVLIQAKDMGGQLGGLAGTTTINITLSDVNDNPPRFSKSFFHLRVPESSALGSAVGRIKAHDLDVGRNAEVEYTIVPGDGGAMFDITTNSHNQEGIIILKKSADTGGERGEAQRHGGCLHIPSAKHKIIRDNRSGSVSLSQSPHAAAEWPGLLASPPDGIPLCSAAKGLYPPVCMAEAQTVSQRLQ
ncbi:unnamed protein product [Pleuronectes platessa]|uniref:Cadherin domain-containing protein n=1 Tax=Pleuronectes platessa TaxID=8262 RepID=A0A9N7V8U2_PLEPL|nr:unnamed protein product [Pleuronectes platessa]